MASKKTVLTVTSTNSGDLSFDTDAGAQNNLRAAINHLEAGLNGSHAVPTVVVRDSAVSGSLTITLASMAAGTVLLINGVPFTAKGSAATAGNNEFDVSGGTDTLDATALAAAINASTSAGITGVLTATSAAAVVTLTASQEGLVGNGITVENLGVVATGTVTYVTPSGAQTITINGVTAYSATAGATAAATATAAAAAINALSNALVSKHVRALARAGVVHVFAKYGGVAGNAITLAATGTGATASVARLAGGTVEQYEGAQASQTALVSGADGGTYRTTLNGVNIDVSGSAGNDAATAALIVAAVNASTNALVRNLVYATDEGTGNIVFWAVRGGHQGNAITVAVTGTGYSVDGARLEAGALPTVSVIAGGTATPVGGGANMTSGSNGTALTLTL